MELGLGFRPLSLNPQIKYFQKNVNYPFFKNGDFWGGTTSKIEFEQNWRYGYVLTYIMDSG